MATNYPASADDGTTLPDPASGNFQSSPSHSSLHGNANGAIKALEAKVGTGATTPAANKVLLGTGSGTSAWQGLTSAELRGVLSDETGTGSAVFATTPTLVTPKVDTINESTLSNGVTIAGLNIKNSALNTNNSVVTTNITNASVTASKLATGATSADQNTSSTTTSTAYTSTLADALTTSVTVTIGANGVALVAVGAFLLNSGANFSLLSWAVSGATTIASSDSLSYEISGTTGAGGTFTHLQRSLTAGSTTFTLQYRVVGGTGTFSNRHISVVPL